MSAFAGTDLEMILRGSVIGLVFGIATSGGCALELSPDRDRRMLRELRSGFVSDSDCHRGSLPFLWLLAQAGNVVYFRYIRRTWISRSAARARSEPGLALGLRTCSRTSPSINSPIKPLMAPPPLRAKCFS